MSHQILRSSRWPTLRGAALACLLALIAWSVLGSAGSARADVNDFSYDSWEVDVELSLNDEGRAIAHVTETLTARFPESDQNRGIVRGIPEDYEGSSTDPRDFSVSDENGDPVPFEIERDDGFVAVLTGDDGYVHGRQVYVISYTLSDVVLARDDGAADEFYWDLMDFEHLQPVSQFSAAVHFSSDLAEHVNGDMRCYTGPAHSDRECAIATAAEGSRVEVAPLPLGPREGVTVAIGLDAGTATQPPARLPNFALDVMPLFAGGGALVAGIAGMVAVSSLRRKRRSARGVVVAQYDVPAWLPPLVAGPVLGVSTNPVPAELVHLAVSGAIRIEDGTEGTGLFGSGKPQPVLRLLDPARSADPLDAATLQQVFSGAPAGTAFPLPKRDEKFGQRMTKLQTSGRQAATQRGYFEKVRSPVARGIGIAAIALSVATLALALFALATRNSPTGFICLVLGIGGLILGFAAISKHRVHTPSGAETREYLEGVREFIRVAEADRLQMLQSYEGAERSQEGTIDVIHLYERLLPYAILFGLEKQWTGVLEVKYSEQPGYVPYWYPGVAAHGLGGFTSTISSFTSSLNSSVSYTSSSSGGSTGGGFAGGGGGGGFSGGR